MALGAHRTAFAQTKPGRQSKAVKPNPTATPAANAPTDQKPSGEAESTKPEDKLFKGMKYRLIGPFRGGRSLTAAGIPGDLTTYYFGATGGGVWKSTDGAMSWSPVFDKEGTGDIGSLAVANSDRNTIYVGTGEACLRGNISQGDGVYKSQDAGKTWKNVGLHDSRAIGKVIINPNNPDIVFVAALGHPYGPNSERGIFRTTDGGKNWEKVLYKDENTGGVDVAFDPRNPNVLFAALWQVRRSSWNMNDGGPGSGLYRSADGGSTWKWLEQHGLPKGPYGRIGISVAANSDRVYALIEARNPDGGLYRSEDGGETWDFINPSHSLWQRPWYYMHIIADPRDGCEELFGWYDAGDVVVPSGDPRWSFHVDENSAKMMRGVLANTGALVCGRRLFDHTKGWGDSHPVGAPVVVVTHRPPEDADTWKSTIVLPSMRQCMLVVSLPRLS